MDLKKLKEELKKSKDPEKFLRELMEKTKDKKLKELIKKILEKKESFGESGLEKTVREAPIRIPRREPEPNVEIPEAVNERRETVVTGGRPDLVVEGRRNQDYGLRAGGKDYKTGSVIKQLEESNLVAKGGHLKTAETQGLIDRKLGEYDINKEKEYAENKIYDKPFQHEIVKEDETFAEVFHRKKKKGLGDYV